MHVYRRRIVFPWPAEVSPDGAQIRRRQNGAVLYNDPCILVGIVFALCCDSVLLAGHGFFGADVAVLEDDGGVSENEIYSSVNVAFAVELSVGMGVERVLKAVNAAAVEDGLVCA